MWRRVGSAMFGLALLGCGASQALAQAPAAPAVDYGAATSWLCRPSAEAACTADLDAIVVDAQGRRTPQAFHAAANPAIDCFYVYPTVSADAGPFSDMTPGPEELETTRGQAGRLASRCRLFAPVYRQLTLSGLAQRMKTGAALDWSRPYGDVLAAWRWYMAHENHGRGVVLVGHSQGAILLQRLIAEEIDGKPAQARLVAAFLGGDPALPTPQGATVGGAFKHVPLCASAGQTGCAYAWGSYLADDKSAHRLFGHHPGSGMTAACVNPAAPGGGTGDLVAYLPKPKTAPAGDPPWVAVTGQLSAQCVSDAQGDVLRITVKPSRYAEHLEHGLEAYGLGEGWGLHRLDLSLPQGNILEVIDAQTRTWAAQGASVPRRPAGR